MADAVYVIKKSTLEGIGNAVRSKTGKTDEIPVVSLATEIEGIQGGGITTSAKSQAMEIIRVSSQMGAITTTATVSVA